MDLRAGTEHGPAGEHLTYRIESEGGRDERTWINHTAGVRSDGRLDRRRGGQHPDGGDVLECEHAGVEQTRTTGETDVDDPPGGFDQLERVGRKPRRIRRVDHRVERKVGKIGIGPAPPETERPCELESRPGQAE